METPADLSQPLNPLLKNEDNNLPALANSYENEDIHLMEYEDYLTVTLNNSLNAEEDVPILDTTQDSQNPKDDLE